MLPGLGIIKYHYNNNLCCFQKLIPARTMYKNYTLLEMIEGNQAGEPGGKVVQLTLANGGQTMIYADNLPAEEVAAAKQAEADSISGKITVPLE